MAGCPLPRRPARSSWCEPTNVYWPGLLCGHIFAGGFATVAVLRWLCCGWVLQDFVGLKKMWCLAVWRRASYVIYECCQLACHQRGFFRNAVLMAGTIVGANAWVDRCGRVYMCVCVCVHVGACA